MNRKIFLAGLVVLGCQSPESGTIDDFRMEISTGTEIRRQVIDIENSRIEWTGTKLMGAGSHTGTVKFKSGYLIFDGERLTGGRVIADMTTIWNTDIPLTDPVPREKLTKHLNEDLETEQFSEASFEFSRVLMSDDGYKIIGKLRIKDITRQIEVSVAGKEGQFTSHFSIDRESWGIGENGSWLERKLVDESISLTVVITTIP